jgi:hypothetical protein
MQVNAYVFFRMRTGILYVKGAFCQLRSPSAFLAGQKTFLLHYYLETVFRE